MRKNEKFQVRICSDLDYEEMVADICYENQTIALITQENGVDNMEIKIFSSEKTNISTFPLDGFIETIALAKKYLIEMQKIPETNTEEPL